MTFKILTALSRYINYYSVEDNKIITAVDSKENLIDISAKRYNKDSERYAMFYTLSEAKELVNKYKQEWPDYADDKFYHANGEPHYPLFERKPYPKEAKRYGNYTIYRTWFAGEYRYGITENGRIALEGNMDDWENWIRDRKQIIQDSYLFYHQ